MVVWGVVFLDCLEMRFFFFSFLLQKFFLLGDEDYSSLDATMQIANTEEGIWVVIFVNPGDLQALCEQLG